MPVGSDQFGVQHAYGRHPVSDGDLGWQRREGRRCLSGLLKQEVHLDASADRLRSPRHDIFHSRGRKAGDQQRSACRANDLEGGPARQPGGGRAF
ncbi:hypothetical protein GCM10010317_031300 [Streptomyces mirabilis]|nr:hypothetical protein GCM10010317_031300 [Streptomyces mirabilis]